MFNSVLDDGAIQLDGKDYVSYVLREPFDSTFKSISVSFRTEASEGYLFYAKGNDYCFLEVCVVTYCIDNSPLLQLLH